MKFLNSNHENRLNKLWNNKIKRLDRKIRLTLNPSDFGTFNVQTCSQMIAKYRNLAMEMQQSLELCLEDDQFEDKKYLEQYAQSIFESIREDLDYYEDKSINLIHGCNTPSSPVRTLDLKASSRLLIFSMFSNTSLSYHAPTTLKDVFAPNQQANF